jgi:hypothetical protein
MPCPLWRLQNLPERAQRLKRMPRPTSRSRSGPLLRSPRAFPSGYPRHQRVTNCVRTAMRGRRWTQLNGMLNSPNRPLSEQQSKRRPNIRRW